MMAAGMFDDEPVVEEEKVIVKKSDPVEGSFTFLLLLSIIASGISLLYMLTSSENGCIEFLRIGYMIVVPILQIFLYICAKQTATEAIKVKDKIRYNTLAIIVTGVAFAPYFFLFFVLWGIMFVSMLIPAYENICTLYRVKKWESYKKERNVFNI